MQSVVDTRAEQLGDAGDEQAQKLETTADDH